MYSCALFSLCFGLSLVNVSHCLGNRDAKNVSVEAAHHNFTIAQRKWVADLFDMAREQFDVVSQQNTQCRRDYDLYQLHYRNQSIWAVRMKESTEWPEIGIIAGMRYHMGNWAECVAVNSYGIQGQYCLAKAVYDFLPDRLNYTLEEVAAEETSAWVALKMYLENPVRVNRHVQSWAMCIPTSCTAADLEESLTHTVKPVFEKHGFNVTVSVDAKHCSTDEVSIKSKNPQMVKAFFLILILMLTGATIFDVIENEYKDVETDNDEPAMKEFILSFSVMRNTRQLIKSKPSDHPPIHFTKIIAMLFIIFGHLFIYTLGFPTFNTEYIENEYRKWNIALSRTSIVDLFFAISGLLTCYYSLESTKKGGVIFLIFSFIIRWLRMVPVFGVLMVFIIYCLPHLGNGPYWKERIFREVDHCSSSWWTNMLAVNNFIEPEKQCLLISWYIAVDIQLAILGCIVLYVLVKNRKLGYMMVGLTFIIGNVATFVAVYVNKYYGLTRLFMSFQEEPRRSFEFNYFYVHPYPRIAPYMFGFATALIAFELKERNYKFGKMRSWLTLFVLLMVSEGSQWYGLLFYQFGRKYNVIENSLYAAVNRWLFLMPYSYLCIQHLTTGIQPLLDKIINHKIYVPLGRLTYSVFLVNTVVELYLASVQGDLMSSSTSANMYIWTTACVVFSYSFGLIFYLCVEAPCVNLTKLFQRTLLKTFVPAEKMEHDTDGQLPQKTNDYNMVTTGNKLT